MSTRLLAILDVYLKERFMILNCSRRCLGRYALTTRLDIEVYVIVVVA